MKFIRYIICLLIVSCGNNQSEKVENKEVDYDEICKCITMEIEKDEFDGLTYEEKRNKISNCVIPFSGNDFEKYNEVIGNAMSFCPDFIRKFNDLELKKTGWDTVIFDEIKKENCNNLFLDKEKWKDVLGEPNSYSVISNDTNYHYENGKINSIWLRIMSKECINSYKVIYKTDHLSIPPKIGDTVSFQIIGVRDTLVKCFYVWKKLRIVTISHKIP